MTLKNSERYSIYIHVRMCVSAVLWRSPFPLSTTVAVRQRGKADRVNDKKKKKGGDDIPLPLESPHIYQMNSEQTKHRLPKSQNNMTEDPPQIRTKIKIWMCFSVYTHLQISRCTHKRHRCVSAHLRDTQTEVQRNEADIFLQIQWSGYKNADRL